MIILEVKRCKMAYIKSALELAMEKTEGLKTDPGAVRIKEIKTEGRRAASAFLNGTEDSPEELLAVLKKYKKNERDAFKEGVIITFLSNIILPKISVQEDRIGRITSGIKAVSKDKNRVEAFMEQIKEFFSKYLENREELIQTAKDQYMPRLKQKEQELEQQTGQKINLSPEQDPEFMEFLNQNISRLEAQYTQSLNQAKEELKRFIG